MTSSTDCVEKKLLLRAPINRVWQAIADSTAFGDWFGMEFPEPFAAGSVAKGCIRPTKCDDDVAAAQARYDGMPLELHIEQIEPMRLFSYRWHPFAIDASVDYSNEPMTLVTFELEPAEGGTLLTVRESGFDALPLGRRTDAFEANEEGWGAIVPLVGKYLSARLA
ncbi:MAG TPA: SRPBCC family protein [Candidatus Tumulicola sp.]|jgi:uncharacterized protein YndB with AHSA1/START domain